MSRAPVRPGILISQADCRDELEAEFDAWYDSEHIPVRLALPGFDVAERYHSVEDGSQKHLVLYHLSDLAVLDSAEYVDVKMGSGNTALTRRMLSSVRNFTRLIGEEVADSHPAAGIRRASELVLLLVGNVPADRWAEVNQAHEQDYLPQLEGAPGWDRCRRYRILDSSPNGINLAVLHELSSVAALESTRRLVARSPMWEEKQIAAYRRRADRPNALVG